ncbi:hypothetical protein GHT06_017482 [Daphnia sinensis]|uniref:Uncharacterized protein n=1 Tax=Daphnia sinensis TaxID=1820382 RepID=A0AAD5PV29_9CRUS|nr:hypothetical protein GHT06_017482 [Daphnia sinensis]
MNRQGKLLRTDGIKEYGRNLVFGRTIFISPAFVTCVNDPARFGTCANVCVTNLENGFP